MTEGTGGITAMCPCDDFLELYKEDTTFRFETPETIDPDRTNPNAPFAAMISDRIGSSNPIIARVLLQGRDILESALFVEPVDNKAVIRVLHGVKESLIACHKASQGFSFHFDSISTQITAGGLRLDRSGRVLQSLPQVPDLDSTATQFLISSKRAIKAICSLAPLFLALGKADNNFDHLGERLEKLLGADAPLTGLVREYANVSRYLIELRNAQEHPRAGKRTHIENFRIQPDGSVAPPTWYVTGNRPGQIHAEMPAAIARMIEMAEWMLIHLVDHRLDSRLPFVIHEIDEAALDPKLPIRYRLRVDVSRLNLGDAISEGKE